MGRTKWKNRTPEDQARILEEQKKLKEKGEDRRKYGTIATGFVKAVHDNKTPLAIYNCGGIPILCVEHGWVESKLYTIGVTTNLLTGDRPFDVVKGKCPECNKEILRAMMTFTGNEIMLVAMIINKLMQSGRLQDLRKRGV